MEGSPSQFEVIGSRLGFRISEENPDRLCLLWRGARFPAFLCLGIAISLLFLSIPIFQAILLRGLQGPAASLWYFPVMNLILIGIAIFLLSLERKISLNDTERRIVIRKRNIFRQVAIGLAYEEVDSLKLGADEVYSGFALAGSSAAQRYPVPSLRLVLKCGKTVLLDRGGRKRLASLGQQLSEHLGKPLEMEGTSS